MFIPCNLQSALDADFPPKTLEKNGDPVVLQRQARYTASPPRS